MLVRVEFSQPSTHKRHLPTLSAFAITCLLTIFFIGWVIYRWLVQPAWFARLSSPTIEVFDLFEFGATATLLILWGIVIYWQYQRYRIMHTPTVDDLYALSPYEFEEYVGEIFERKGYSVYVRGRSGDSGVDLELRKKGGKKAIVQCKRYGKTVGSEVVRELYGTLLHERVAHAFLVTTATISKAARDWAKGKPITLIDGKDLVEIARELPKKRPLKTKWLNL